MDNNDQDNEDFTMIATIELNEALNSSESQEWADAIKSEIKAQLKNDGWVKAKKKNDVHVIGSKFVLTNKYKVKEI